MKKFLSIILSCVMIMSLFCVIPAYAEKLVGVKYFFEDFESGAVNANISGKPTIHTGGVNGSKYSAKFTSTFHSSSSEAYHEIRIGQNTGWKLETGDKIQISGSICFSSIADGVSSNGLMQLISGYKASDGTTNVGYDKGAYLQTNSAHPNFRVNPTLNNWQSFSISWKNTGAPVVLNNSNYYLTLRIHAAKNSVFLLDNIEVEINNKDSSENDPILSNLKARMNSDYTIDYSYDFVSSGDDVSVIKLKDGNTILGTYSTGNTIYVPTEHQSSRKLNIEIIPIDSKGNIANSRASVSLVDSASYVLTAFEDGINIDMGTQTGYTASVTSGGVGSSEYGYSVSVTEDNKSPEFDVALKKGRSYDVSMWIRADKNLKINDSVSLVFEQISADSSISTGVATYEKALTLDENLLRGEWVYAYGTIENFDGKAIANLKGESVSCEVLPIGKVAIKVGDGIVANTADTSIDYTIDDLTIMPREYYNQKTPDEISKGLDFYTFDSSLPVSTSAYNSDGWKLVAAKGTVVTPDVETKIEGVEKPLGNYLKIDGGTNSNYNQLQKNEFNMQNGPTYEVCLWMKADNEVSLGKKPRIIISRSYFNEDGTKSSNAYTYASIKEVTDNTNGTTTDIDQFGLTNEWRYYKLNIVNKTVENRKVASTLLIIRADDKAETINADFSVGNISVRQKEDKIDALIPVGCCNAFPATESLYTVNYNYTVASGDIEKVFMRIMLPYKEHYFIRKLESSSKNEDVLQIAADGFAGAKMVLNAKDLNDNFGSEAYFIVKQPSEVGLTVVTEFDQPVWAPDMEELSATVSYNNATGDETLMALCGTYDEDNKMISYDVQEIELLNGEGKAELSMAAGTTAKYAKIYLWEKNGLSPIKKNVAQISKTDNKNFIYVNAKTGIDTNEGAYKTPLKTVKGAFDKYKTDLASGKLPYSDSYIVLMPGRYFQTTSISIDNTYTQDGKNLTITSYNKNDQAEISGGYDISGQFTNTYKDGIYYAEIDVNQFGFEVAPRQLFVNGVKATKARSEILTNVINTTTYRKSGEVEGEVVGDADKVKELGHLESTDMSLLKYQRPKDLEFVFYGLWTNHRCQVASMEAGTRETSEGQENVVKLYMDEPGWSTMCSRPHTSGNVSVGGFPPRYMENALELLDEPGEWYMDYETGRVYYMPRANENIKTAEIIIPVIDNLKQTLMCIEGTKLNNVEDITFDNITFTHTTWTRPSTAVGHADVQNNNVVNTNRTPEAAVDLKYTDNISFINCKFTKLGITGLRLLKGTSNCNIIGNEFYEISGSAACLGPVGTTDTDSSHWLKLPNAGDKIDNIHFENNYIHHVARDYHGASGLSIGFPSNCVVAHNEIAFTPYTGMHVGYGWESKPYNPATGKYEEYTALTIDITDNYIHDLFQGNIYDGAAIYTLGMTGGTVENPNKVSGNFAENIGPGGISYYNDQGSTGYEYFNNVSDISDSWSEVCLSTKRTKGPANCMNINTMAKGWSQHLNWHDNYTTVFDYYISDLAAADKTNSFELPIVVANLRENPITAAIIENAGIEPEYRKNFKAGLQNMMVIDDVVMTVGQVINNTPYYITSKDKTYKNNDLVCEVYTSDASVATANRNQITAVGKGEATITYTVLEGEIYTTRTTKVVVE